MAFALWSPAAHITMMMTDMSLSTPKYVASAIMAACALCACANDAPPSASRASAMTASMTPIAVTRLHESDTAYIGNPIHLAVTSF